MVKSKRPTAAGPNSSWYRLKTVADALAVEQAMPVKLVIISTSLLIIHDEKVHVGVAKV